MRNGPDACGSPGMDSSFREEEVMKVGIIGAGQIGGTLTRRFRSVGHEVFVANSRGPVSLAGLAKETGAKPVTASEAARAGEVVVVTIPEREIRKLPKDLFEGVPQSAVVLDTGNYYPRERDGRIDEIEQGMTESRWVSRQLGRPVVKAFNNIYARHLLEKGKPAGAPGRIALPVAGDDEAAKKIVMGLIDEIGFDAVDAGGIDESWRQQPGTPVYAADLDAEGVRRALAQASRERKPQWRATDKSPGSFAAPA
jgi:predicted dinucleotide-binding enzyme